MANKKTSPNVRGDSAHYRAMAELSRNSRIKRHIECAVVAEEGVILPSRVRDTDAGYDLYAIKGQNIPLNSSHKFSTGLKIRCPEGYFYRIEDRSSLIRRGLRIIRQSPIDATYTGPISVVLYNVGGQDLEPIEKGDRIAQIVFYPQIHVKFNLQSEFTPEQIAQRGGAGYGSTGR